MKKILIAISLGMVLMAGSCDVDTSKTASQAEAEGVGRQQEQYAIAQPVPAYDYSLERDLLIQLYNIRNQEVTTHSVWRSNYGLIEGDCRSMGFGMPYDTSLTNPSLAVWNSRASQGAFAGVTIGQPEPNGIFASTNTSATWVFCISDAGGVEPVYIESKVTVYPGPVNIDYSSNIVTREGQATVQLELPK